MSVALRVAKCRRDSLPLCPDSFSGQCSVIYRFYNLLYHNGRVLKMKCDVFYQVQALHSSCGWIGDGFFRADGGLGMVHLPAGKTML